MGTWQDGLLEAMTEYVQTKHGPESYGVTRFGYTAIDPELTVVDYEDTSGWSGGCETCEFYDTNITFYMSDGSTQKFSGSFAELMNVLT